MANKKSSSFQKFKEAQKKGKVYKPRKKASSATFEGVDRGPLKPKKTKTAKNRHHKSL